MKALIFLASALFISNVYADSIGVLDCGTDKGVSLELVYYPDATSFDALVVEHTEGAEDVYTQYLINKDPDAFIYTGKDFKLVLDASTLSADLEAINVNGNSVKTHFKCTIY